MFKFSLTCINLSFRIFSLFILADKYPFFRSFLISSSDIELMLLTSCPVFVGRLDRVSWMRTGPSRAPEIG